MANLASASGKLLYSQDLVPSLLYAREKKKLSGAYTKSKYLAQADAKCHMTHHINLDTF